MTSSWFLKTRGMHLRVNIQHSLQYIQYTMHILYTQKYLYTQTKYVDIRTSPPYMIFNLLL